MGRRQAAEPAQAPTVPAAALDTDCPSSKNTSSPAAMSEAVRPDARSESARRASSLTPVGGKVSKK
eukprot:13569330-Alexandrium_andersonii.AAC.1